MSKSVRVVKNFRAPTVAGEHYRLLCLSGDKKGISYYIDGKRLIIGRSNTAEVQILDEKASREHAEIARVQSNFIITDLSSQNGVVVNDLKIKQHRLEPGDMIVIGSTVFKFEYFKVEEAPLATIEKTVSINKPKIGQEKKEEKKKKTSIIPIAGAALLLMLVFDDFSSKEEKPKTQKKRRFKDISSEYEQMLEKKKEAEDNEQQRKVETIILRGQREYREGNYYRAIEEFQQALILDPSNGHAAFYKRKSEQDLNDAIDEMFVVARRKYESFKLHAAAQTYCGILRLLRGVDDDERYQLAEDQIKTLEKKMGMIEGEFNCLPQEQKD